MRSPLLLLAALLVVACASDPPAPAGCSPGEQRACLCTSGAGTVGSTQLCGPDRTFGTCDCPDGSAPMDVGAMDVGAMDVGAMDVGAMDVGAPTDAPDVGTVDLGADIASTDVGADAPAMDLGTAIDTGVDVPSAVDVVALDVVDAGADAADVVDAVADSGPADTGTTEADRADVVDAPPADAGPTDVRVDTGPDVPACAADYGDCDGNPANGCETYLRSNRTHCGACGNLCVSPANAAAICNGGVCSSLCSPGFGNCDGDLANGCETNTNTTAAHCGACGRGCTTWPFTVPACASGACLLVCASDRANCDGQEGNGCEVDTRTSATHCGGCGRACAAGETCVTGVCTPPPCTNDAIRCNTAGTGVERCVSGAWQLARTCVTTGLPSGSSASCYQGGCAYCLPGDGGPACGPATCDDDDDCYRSRDGRCIDGRCSRRGILPCSAPSDCLPWIVSGVTSACTADVSDLNGATVRACTGSLVGPCTADHQCPRAYRCDLRSGVCRPS